MHRSPFAIADDLPPSYMDPPTNNLHQSNNPYDINMAGLRISDPTPRTASAVPALHHPNDNQAYNHNDQHYTNSPTRQHTGPSNDYRNSEASHYNEINEYNSYYSDSGNSQFETANGDAESSYSHPPCWLADV